MKVKMDYILMLLMVFGSISLKGQVETLQATVSSPRTIRIQNLINETSSEVESIERLGLGKFDSLSFQLDSNSISARVYHCKAKRTRYFLLDDSQIEIELILENDKLTFARVKEHSDKFGNRATFYSDFYFEMEKLFYFSDYVKSLEGLIVSFNTNSREASGLNIHFTKSYLEEYVQRLFAKVDSYR